MAGTWEEQMEQMRQDLHRLNRDLRAARQEAADAQAEAQVARQEAAQSLITAGLAGGGGGGGGGPPRISKIALDPGKYDGDKKTFAEWWAKVTIWLKVNETAVTTDFARAVFVWSRLEGSIAGKYAQTRMTQCSTTTVWPTWRALHEEMEATFSPQIERDWARNAIQNLRQGSSRVDDYCTKWETLQRQSGVSDEHGVFLLERNTSPTIIQQIFLMGLRKQTVAETLAEIKKVGRAQESYYYSYGGAKPNQGRAWSNNAQASSSNGGAKTYGGQGQPMDIGAAQTGKCFNCNGPHLVRDCKLPKVPCGSCKWLGGRHKNDCKQSKGKAVRTAETAPADPSVHTAPGPLQGMDYEAAKAYFADLLETEKKHAAAAGKGASR
jgi:hypothetical protein